MSDREKLINTKITWSKTRLNFRYQIIFYEKLKRPVTQYFSKNLLARGSNNIGP